MYCCYCIRKRIGSEWEVVEASQCYTYTNTNIYIYVNKLNAVYSIANLHMLTIILNGKFRMTTCNQFYSYKFFISLSICRL